MKEFAEQLRLIQQDRHWTQARLAKELGISPGTLSGYLNDKNNPQINDVAEFAKKLGVSIGWLCGENPPTPGTLFNGKDVSYGEVLGVIDEMLTLQSDAVGHGRDMFEVEIKQEEDYGIDGATHFKELFELSTLDGTIIQYYKTVKKVRDLYKDGTIDEKTYNDIISSKRKALENELIYIGLPF